MAAAHLTRRLAAMKGLRAWAKSNNAAALSTSSRVMYGGGGSLIPDELPIKVDIGKREVVGFGYNGEESYIDDFMIPFPAIRFKEETAETSMLREKEKGDWKKMTLEEKKTLYRASFCQTFAESEAHSNEFIGDFGQVFFFIGVGLWFYIWMVKFVYDDLPITITDEARVRAQIKRMIDMRVNPIEGFTSGYDYEKNDWKVNLEKKK